MLLAGVGASAAILGGLPLLAAAGIGAAAWAARVAMGLPRRPKHERIDPFRVGEPWRRFVQDALQAETRFGETVRRTRPGPLQTELSELGERISAGVREAWRVAQQGDNLDAALRRMDPRGIYDELQQVDAERRRYGDGAVPASLEQTYASVRAQYSAAERLTSVATGAVERLRLLNAQLDEAVARAIELSVSSPGADELGSVTQEVDNIVMELEALRQGLEEAGGASAVARG